MEGSPMEVLHRKLKGLKTVLRNFNTTYFARISERVKDKRKELNEVQTALLSPTNPIKEKIQKEKNF